MKRAFLLFGLAAAALALACADRVPTAVRGGAGQVAPSNPAAAIAGAHRTIIVDGDTSDWKGIEPLILDPSGDVPNDLRSIRIANDQHNMYFLVQLSFAPGAGLWVMFDTDQNPSTGCGGVEEDLVLRKPIEEVSFEMELRADLWMGSYCQAASGSFWSTQAWGDDVVEFSVPIDALRALGMSRQVRVAGNTTGNDWTEWATFRILGAPPLPEAPPDRP